ncbi:histidine kinase [Nostoc sp. TCL26-01]|nr:histidine kinase [Nostoc sp. TCL26-01]
MDCQQEIQKLEKSHRVLQKKLERSELDLVKLEETNSKKQALLKKVIEELRESQGQLQEKSQELENTLMNLRTMQDKMSALGGLVADVAHEINNPVGFIVGNLTPALEYIHDLLHLIDLYQHYYPHPVAEIKTELSERDFDYVREDLPKLIASMKEGTDRISNISNSLRTFSRTDTEHKLSFNIHESINSTLFILKHRLKSNSLRPEIKIVKNYGELPAIKCFPGQLSQVFMNIFANAIDALEESVVINQSSVINDHQELPINHPTITIQTTLTAYNKSAVIQIRDNALGMSEEVKSRIFEHSYTTKPVGKGTGLGLAIAHQIIVQKHKGSLEVNSTLGVGSEFVITLPIAGDFEDDVAIQ